ncbi:MAG TPA: ABC transporter permease [Ktedonobacterales bacterium]
MPLTPIPPTEMPPAPRKQPWLVQLGDLLLMELTNWRWSWRMLVITSTITPLLSMVALGLFARNAGQEALGYILTGNVVLALMFGMMEKVQSRFSFMRVMGTLDYFATLPITRFTLILAMVLSFLLLSLPSLIVTIGVGALVLALPLQISPLLIAAVPLCAVPLSGIGALIAANARTPEESNALTLLATFVLLGLGPVIFPASRLPGFVLVLGHFSPATYAASALRQTLLGPVTGELALDLAVLAGVSVLIFWLVGRKMQWRQR